MQESKTTRLPKTHMLKTDIEPFRHILMKTKRSEIRKLDRDFQVGDLLTLMEWPKDVCVIEGNSNTWNNGLLRHIKAVITHIQTGYGLPDDIGVLSFEILGCEVGGNS